MCALAAVIVAHLNSSQYLQRFLSALTSLSSPTWSATRKRPTTKKRSDEIAPASSKKATDVGCCSWRVHASACARGCRAVSLRGARVIRRSLHLGSHSAGVLGGRTPWPTPRDRAWWVGSRGQLLPELLPGPDHPPAPANAEGPATCITAGHGPNSRRRMGDSNPRGLSPNTLSKCLNGGCEVLAGVGFRRSARCADGPHDPWIGLDREELLPKLLPGQPGHCCRGSHTARSDDHPSPAAEPSSAGPRRPLTKSTAAAYVVRPLHARTFLATGG